VQPVPRQVVVHDQSSSAWRVLLPALNDQVKCNWLQAVVDETWHKELWSTALSWGHLSLGKNQSRFLIELGFLGKTSSGVKHMTQADMCLFGENSTPKTIKDYTCKATATINT